MRQSGWIMATLATAALAGCGGGGVRGEIGQACMAGGRQAANPALCSCVQNAANQTLTAAEQRRAASFFEDPHRAQETRQSGRAGDSEFWRRYRAFADHARAACG